MPDDEVEAGRALLRNQQSEDALARFEAAYEAASEELAAARPGEDADALKRFVWCAYWRSAALTKLRRWQQAEQQTHELLKIADERDDLTSTDCGLIHYARGRYFLDAGAFDDAIWCFKEALNRDGSLERAHRDRIRAYRSTNSHAALYYAMLAVHIKADSFDLQAEFARALLGEGLWPQAERVASDLAAGYPHRLPVALVLHARAMMGQGHIGEALAYCTRALELAPEYQEAQEVLTTLGRPLDSTVLQEPQEPALESAEASTWGPEPGFVPVSSLDEPEIEWFTPEDAERNKRIEEWLEKGQSEQDHAKAIYFFDLVLNIDPGNMSAVCGKVNCLRLTHKPADARAMAEDAIERYQADWRLYIELGRILHGQGEYTSALEWYDKAAAMKPGDVEVSIARSNTLCAQGNVGMAADLINELLKAEENRDDFLLREEWAWIAFFQRNYADADATFKELHDTAEVAHKAAEAAPNANWDGKDENSARKAEHAARMAKARYGRGYVAMKRGDNAGAMDHFNAARSKVEDVDDYQLAWAWSKAKTYKSSQNKAGDQLEEAKQVCRRIARVTGNPLAYSCLGVIYFKLNYPNDSETSFKNAAEGGRTYASHVDLGALYASQGRNELAEQEFCAAIDSDPHDADAHYELGALLLSTRDERKLKDAESEFKKAKADDPYSGRAVLGLARSYRLQGRMPEAERELRRAIGDFAPLRDPVSNSDLWRLHMELAALLIELGDKTQGDVSYSRAYGEAQAAIKLASREWEPQYTAALAAQRTGDFGRALSHLKQCQECDHDPVAVAMVESLQIDLGSRQIDLESSKRAARMSKTLASALSGMLAVFAFIAFVFICLSLAKVDRQSIGMISLLSAMSVGLLLVAFFSHRLLEFNIAKVFSAKLAPLPEQQPPEQQLPVGPAGQLPAVGDRFDLPPRPFGQQLRRTSG